MKKICSLLAVLVSLLLFVDSYAIEIFEPVFIADYQMFAQLLGATVDSSDFDNEKVDENTTRTTYDCLSVDWGNDFLVKRAMLLIRYPDCDIMEMDTRAQALFMACLVESNENPSMATVAKLSKVVEPHMEALKKTMTEKEKAIISGQIVLVYSDNDWYYSLFQSGSVLALFADPLE